MADGIYVGMSGAVARAEQLDAIADNLANMQSPGFRAARPAFETFLPGNGAGDKAFTAAVDSGVDLRPGMTQRTGNALDVLPENGAFLSVQTPTGQQAFTRNGHLTVDANGRLTSGGNLVLSTAGRPIDVPLDAKVAITAQGVVLADGLPGETVQRVHLEGGVARLAPTLVVPKGDGKAVPSDAAVRSGELEMGNSNALESTVQMVSAQRNYETSMQAIQTYRRLDERATELGKVR